MNLVRDFSKNYLLKQPLPSGKHERSLLSIIVSSSNHRNSITKEVNSHRRPTDVNLVDWSSIIAKENINNPKYTHLMLPCIYIRKKKSINVLQTLLPIYSHAQCIAHNDVHNRRIPCKPRPFYMSIWTAAINYALHFSINIIFLICRWFSISITLKPRCFLVLWKLLIWMEQMRKRNKSGPISSWNRITMIFYQTKSETKQMVRWIKLRFVLITYVCQICSVNQSVDLSLLIFIMR